MDQHGFEAQVDRLASYFRHGKTLLNDQKTEWWRAMQGQDLEDWTRAVDRLVAEGVVGRMPSIQQAQAATYELRRRRKQADQAFAATLEDVPATPGFQEDAKVNLLRLWRATYNPRGKLLPQHLADEPDPTNPDKPLLTAAQKALGNLYTLADRHGVDVDRWPFMPDGNHARLKAHGTCAAFMAMPRNCRPPTQDELELLNPWWVEHVMRPQVAAKLEGGA